MIGDLTMNDKRKKDETYQVRYRTQLLTLSAALWLGATKHMEGLALMRSGRDICLFLSATAVL